MQALFEGNGEGLPQQEIDRLKRIRLDCQAILTQPRPPKVRAVIHETALRLPIGGADVMHERLLHLAEVSRLPNVEIQLQPTPAGMYPGIGIAFLLMRLDNDRQQTVCRWRPLENTYIATDRPPPSPIDSPGSGNGSQP